MRKKALYLLLCLVFVAGACHWRAKPTVQPPDPPYTIITTNQPLVLPQPIHPNLQPIMVSPPLSPFQTAVHAFEDAKYDGAAQAFEELLQSPDPRNRDGALFYLAMSHGMQSLSGSYRDIRSARDEFDDFLANYPKSQYRNAAFVMHRLLTQIAGLMSERADQLARQSKDLKEKEAQIDQLKDELQKLKEIDMNRRPSRPPP
ncbi:MAG TPA: hypothetical protein VE398_24730 [Acidobacteriota bacterium]|nr:hypothetical protein [Acidobacteriota bacterium]